MGHDYGERTDATPGQQSHGQARRLPDPSTGQMQGGSGVVRIELAIAANRVRCAQYLDGDATSRELLDHRRCQVHPAFGAGSDQQPLGEFRQDLGEVLDYELVSPSAQPVCDGAARQEDHVGVLLLPVDHDPPNA